MRSDRVVIGIAVALFLAAYTAIAFGFLNVPEGEIQLVYLALLGAPVALAVVLWPQAALIVLAALVYSIDWLSEFWELVPREATWLIDILIWILIGRTLLLMPGRKVRMPKIEKLIFLALAFALLSALLNRLGMTTVMIGLRVAFRYVFLYLAAYHMNVSRRWLRGFIIYLFVIGLIQTPIIIAQYNYLGWTDQDALCGTFGHSQTPGIAIFLLTLLCFLAARIIEDRRLRITDVLIIGFMSISPVLGEAKFYFLFLPVLLAFMIRSELFKRPVISLALFVFGFAIIYTADYAILSTGGWAEGRNPLTYVTRLRETFESELQEPPEDTYERTYVIVSGMRLAMDNPKDFLVGNGPGSITRSYVSQNHSPKAAYYARWGLNSGSQSIAWLLIEYGYFGTALLFSILWMIFRRGRVLRSSPERELRIYGRMLESMTFLYTAWLFYINAWQSDGMNFIYWPLAAMFVYLSHREEARQLWVEQERRRASLRPAPPPAELKTT